MGNLLAELLKLSPAERIQLAEDLWDSVAADANSLPPSRVRSAPKSSTVSPNMRAIRVRR